MSVDKITPFALKLRKINKGYRRIRFSNEESDFYAKSKKQYDYAKNSPYSWKMKRLIDVTHSALGLLLTMPLLLVSAAAIKLESKGPVLFRQKRVGKDGKPFTIYKLRTMYDDVDHNTTVKSSDDKRITKVGKILRKYSIDEFPQFYNILKGDMSIVGPRPILPEEHRADIQDFTQRYLVKPGAKLKYGKLDSFDSVIRAKSDNEYATNWSLKTDFKIFRSIVSDVLLGKNY